MKANHDGYWYDSHAAIIGVVEAYEMHEARIGRHLELAPLRRLAEKLQAGEDIHQDDTDAVLACLNRMRAETQAMTIYGLHQIACLASGDNVRTGRNYACSDRKTAKIEKLDIA